MCVILENVLNEPFWRLRRELLEQLELHLKFQNVFDRDGCSQIGEGSDKQQAGRQTRRERPVNWPFKRRGPPCFPDLNTDYATTDYYLRTVLGCHGEIKYDRQQAKVQYYALVIVCYKSIFKKMHINVKCKFISLPIHCCFAKRILELEEIVYD